MDGRGALAAPRQLRTRSGLLGFNGGPWRRRRSSTTQQSRQQSCRQSRPANVSCRKLRLIRDPQPPAPAQSPCPRRTSHPTLAASAHASRHPGQCLGGRACGGRARRHENTKMFRFLWRGGKSFQKPFRSQSSETRNRSPLQAFPPEEDFFVAFGLIPQVTFR